MSGSPFTGGQCLVFYDVTITAQIFLSYYPNYNENDPGPIITETARVRGPILAIVPRPSGICAGQCTNVRIILPNNGQVGIIGYATGIAWSAPSVTGVTIMQVSLSRVDGQPDNCGNIPAAPIQPIPQACAAGMPLSQ